MSIQIGTSGWSYPSWKPGFYPQGTPPGEFLRYYCSRFDTVELNTTGYRMPDAEQFARWANAVPDGFRFAPKLSLRRLEALPDSLARLGALGDRLGPVRLVIQSVRNERLLASILELSGSEIELAFDFRHPSWAGVEGVVAVGDLAAEPYRYIRLREPPYSESALRDIAASLRSPAFVYFRHEDEPTAPAYAERLRELLSA